ncbi:hypothetical protein KC19_5G106900 [Ceratodon purpureus]|uniref:Secreted protein n=1 Tax=Ceratodon purpureus TaxID=3225 RepID=A0A8T0I164_CERPU|nr:hypothetical protein KC19_5G106900 [Ceratodon purpureus]
MDVLLTVQLALCIVTCWMCTMSGNGDLHATVLHCEQIVSRCESMDKLPKGIIDEHNVYFKVHILLQICKSLFSSQI